MADAAPASESPIVPPYAAFEHRDFRLYQSARFLATIGLQMQSVAVGWQVYAITNEPLDLGFVGLAQILPAVALSLITGHAADRFDRRRLILLCYLGIAACSAMLFAIGHSGTPSVIPIYVVLVAFGTARAFVGPASQAFMPSLVPPQHFGNAVAWSSSIWQSATILGPAAGGAIYALSAWARGGGDDDGRGADAVYAAACALTLISMVLIWLVRTRTLPREGGVPGWERLVAGIRFVVEKKIILGAISLDLFAVLLGGAVALLPIYAKNILHTGPWGLGFLRSAPALGASAMAMFLAYRPLRRHAGATMLACIAIFGAATIVFGASTNIFLSLAALVVLGASDMVSVVVRQTLVQLSTPDAMRGRVSAVNLVFVGASNELGEFESGLTAHWLGPVPAVLLGGVGTLLVVGMWSFFFPALRSVDRLDDLAARPPVA